MKRMDYETLSMEEIVVEMEDGFLEASAQPAKISKDSKIEVEEYVTIENDISFE